MPSAVPAITRAEARGASVGAGAVGARRGAATTSENSAEAEAVGGASAAGRRRWTRYSGSSQDGRQLRREVRRGSFRAKLT